MCRSLVGGGERWDSTEWTCRFAGEVDAQKIKDEAELKKVKEDRVAEQKERGKEGGGGEEGEDEKKKKKEE